MINEKKLSAALVFIFLCNSLQASNTADHSTSSTQQFINGNCNIIANTQNSNTKFPPVINCPSAPISAAASNALTKIANYIEGSNPTLIELSEIKSYRWAGDAEDFISVTMKNNSNLPARKVSIQMLTPSSNGKQPSRVIKAAQSKSIPKSLLHRLEISNQGSSTIPVIPISALLNATKEEAPADYNYIGASLPGDSSLVDDFLKKNTMKNGYSAETKSTPIAINIKYETIFGEKIHKLFIFYVHFGKASSSQVNNAPTPL